MVRARDGAGRRLKAAGSVFVSLSTGLLYPLVLDVQTRDRGFDEKSYESEPDVLELQRLADLEQAHRDARRAPALGRAAGIEDLEAILLFMQGEVAVAEDDGVGLGEADAHAGEAALRRPGIVG